MTDPMVAFVRARLDEDEVVARAADPELNNALGQIEYLDAATEADERHALRHSPARALAEIEAKRATIRMYEDALDFVAMMGDHGREASHHVVAAESYLNVIQLDASLYDGHPDYLPEWRPPLGLMPSASSPAPRQPS